MDSYAYYRVESVLSDFEDISHTCPDSVNSRKEMLSLQSEGNISSVSQSLDNEGSKSILSRCSSVEISYFVAVSDMYQRNYSLSGFGDDNVNDGLHNSLFSDDKEGFIMKVMTLCCLSYSLLRAIPKKMFVNKSSLSFPFPKPFAETSLFDITKEVRKALSIVVMSR